MMSSDGLRMTFGARRHGRVLVELFPPLIEEVAQKVVDKVFPPPPGEAPAEQLSGFELLQL